MFSSKSAQLTAGVLNPLAPPAEKDHLIKIVIYIHVPKKLSLLLQILGDESSEVTTVMLAATCYGPL